MHNIQNAQNFDKKYMERGDELLDSVFSDDPQLRSRIRVKSPRECKHREVVFSVDYDSSTELSQIIHKLCHWMKDEHSQSDLEGLMLF
jgi:hypothetical protein